MASERATTPPRQADTHYTTPQKAKLQGAIEILNASITKRSEVIEYFGFKPTQAYEILNDTTSRTHHNQDDNETRGRKRKLTGAPVQEADAILSEAALGIEGKSLTWEQLGTEVGADVSSHTMKDTMHEALDYKKCLAYQRGWMDPKLCARRVDYAEIMLSRYPESENSI